MHAIPSCKIKGFVHLCWKIPKGEPRLSLGPETNLNLRGWHVQAITSLGTWQDGTIRGRIMIDMANEPSLLQIKWNRTNVFTNTGVVYPDWSDLWFNTTEVGRMAMPKLGPLPVRMLYSTRMHTSVLANVTTLFCSHVPPLHPDNISMSAYVEVRTDVSSGIG